MSKDDATWLNVVYLVFGILVAYIIHQTFTLVGVQTGWSERYDLWWPYAANAGAVFFGLIGVFLLRRNQERHEYMLAAIGELRKVTWPSADDTKKMTIIVVVVVAIFGALLAAMDLVFGKAISLLLT